MDKKNVQKLKAWIFYEKCIDCYHKQKLPCAYKKNNFHFVMINFFIKT